MNNRSERKLGLIVSEKKVTNTALQKVHRFNCRGYEKQNNQKYLLSSFVHGQ
jgi:hypothetical protein